MEWERHNAQANQDYLPGTSGSMPSTPLWPSAQTPLGPEGVAGGPGGTLTAQALRVGAPWVPSSCFASYASASLHGDGILLL